MIAARTRVLGVSLAFACLVGAGVGFAADPKVQSGFIDLDGGRLFYETAGEGPAMVLLHDGLLHREVYDGQFLEFARSYRVVRYDRRGYGRSPIPDAPYSRIDDLNRVFDQLHIDRAVVIGMSSGGGLAIDFTLEHPEKVGALVLVGAVVSGYGYTPHFFTRGGRFTNEILADPQRMLEYWSMEDPYEIAPGNTEAKRRARELLAANPQDLDFEKSRLENRPRRNAVRALGEILVPTLVVVGEYDIPDVHAHAGVIEAGIPMARRVIVSGAGHLVPLEQPEAFNRAVLDFLRDERFFSILQTEGADGAVRAFREARERDPDTAPFSEGRMNSAGYERLQAGNVDEAIELFKLNAEAYPESWNTYDSLGEAYLAAGKKDLAEKNYRRSLELNPANANAVRVLEELGREE